MEDAGDVAAVRMPHEHERACLTGGLQQAREVAGRALRRRGRPRRIAPEPRAIVEADARAGREAFVQVHPVRRKVAGARVDDHDGAAVSDAVDVHAPAAELRAAATGLSLRPTPHEVMTPANAPASTPL